MRILILLIPTLLCVLSSQGLAARPFDLRAGPGTLHAQSIKPETTSAASPRLDSRAAAARVKQRYQGHKNSGDSIGRGAGIFGLSGQDAVAGRCGDISLR